MRPYPEIGPEFLQSIAGPAVLLLFCLAPHGVFPAARITSRAVSSYLAFSPLPAFSQRTGGMFSVTLSVAAVLQLQRPRVLRGMLPYGVRTFLWQILRHYQRSSAIRDNLAQATQRESTIRHPERQSRDSRGATFKRTSSGSIECRSEDQRHRPQFFFSLVPLIASTQFARKNFFSVGRKVFDGAMIGRNEVVI